MSKLARLLAACLLAAMMLASAIPPAFADTDLEIGGLAIVANTGGDPAMLREGAGYDFTVLLAADEGAVVTVLDGPFAGNDGALWYQVDLDGTSGYIFAAFLVLPENAPARPTGGAAQRARSGGYAATIAGTGGDGARMRDGAELDAAIILVVPEGEEVTVIGKPGYSDGYSWYPVAYAGETGYVAGAFLGDGSAPAVQAATVAPAAPNAPVFEAGAHVQVAGTGGDELRIRETYGLDGSIYGYAPAGAVIRILHGPLWDGAGNAWYGVDFDGLSGYANASYLTWTGAGLSARQVAKPVAQQAVEAAPAPKAAPAPAPAAPAPPASSGRGEKIVAVAMRYAGYPYVWGGVTPSGFDCSGFTLYVLNLALGVNIGRTVDSQIGAGVPIGAKDLAPGDLVFFENTYQPGLSHVGIYIGGGQMIGAASERTGVAIANIWDSYWGPKYVGARRIG